MNRTLNKFLKTSRSKRGKRPFLNEDGAIDVASIMVSVVVLGIVAGLIASTVFVVVPWAQDNAAKNQLKSVMAAQQAFAGMAALENSVGPVGSISSVRFNRPKFLPASNSQTGEYGNLKDLIESELFDPSFLPDDYQDEIYGEHVLSRDKSVCIIKLEAGKGYEAAVRSASGNVFVTNDGWVGPVKISDTDPVCRGRVLGDYDDYENKINKQESSGGVAGVSTTTPTPTSTQTPFTSASPSHDHDDEVAGEDVVVEPTTTPSPIPTATTTPTATATATPTPTATAAPAAPEPAPVTPEANKDPKTKNFKFCHKGSMLSNNFNGMVNGHQGHSEDIMPPIPFKNYAGWNWTSQTAKVYYNNCVPV